MWHFISSILINVLPTLISATVRNKKTIKQQDIQQINDFMESQFDISFNMDAQSKEGKVSSFKKFKNTMLKVKNKRKEKLETLDLPNLEIPQELEETAEHSFQNLPSMTFETMGSVTLYLNLTNQLNKVIILPKRSLIRITSTINDGAYNYIELHFFTKQEYILIPRKSLQIEFKETCDVMCQDKQWYLRKHINKQYANGYFSILCNMPQNSDKWEEDFSVMEEKCRYFTVFVFHKRFSVVKNINLSSTSKLFTTTELKNNFHFF